MKCRFVLSLCRVCPQFHSFPFSKRAFRLAPGPYPWWLYVQLTHQPLLGLAFQGKYQQLSNDPYARTGRTAPGAVSISLSNVSMTSGDISLLALARYNC
ncbi:hypothetical protein PISMIDRAFT_686448 [Pisolithus microcarpus 441]|uniref:Uncharacterized protein n=1 Tax=Pisolithus microcarpus 441 TaxID=765257 RepID=A0A0C9Z8R4_9AGAM|nr:hypothetical protein BKA83DRAFT_686448 [Pisolithus microcarpus]KIK16283.1 hypothetical protein PISMIDRAFT_686448 [Pisolithus microcarpus 441]